MDEELVEEIRARSYALMKKKGITDPRILEDLKRELDGITDPDVVRRNCAFCGRERSRTDDNHAPDCFYWVVVSEEEGDG